MQQIHETGEVNTGEGRWAELKKQVYLQSVS